MFQMDVSGERNSFFFKILFLLTTNRTDILCVPNSFISFASFITESVDNQTRNNIQGNKVNNNKEQLIEEKSPEIS